MSDEDNDERRSGDDRRKYENGRTLDERRAEQADLEGVDALLAEVKNLGTEVHKLRGTLSAYAPRQEVRDEIDKQVSTKIETLEKGLGSTRRSQLIVTTVVLAIFIVLVSVIQWRNSMARNHVVRGAILAACEQRQVLEHTLVDIIRVNADLPRLESAEERERRLAVIEDSIERLQSPPCETLFDNGIKEGS